MAISTNVKVKLENGIEFVVNAAYLKVQKVTATKDSAVAEVHWFKAKGEQKPIQIWQHGFVPALEGDNFIKQAYNHIKTLEEYADAVDC
jgi:hypothetical protein